MKLEPNNPTMFIQNLEFFAFPIQRELRLINFHKLSKTESLKYRFSLNLKIQISQITYWHFWMMLIQTNMRFIFLQNISSPAVSDKFTKKLINKISTSRKMKGRKVLLSTKKTSFYSKELCISMVSRMLYHCFSTSSKTFKKILNLLKFNRFLKIIRCKDLKVAFLKLKHLNPLLTKKLLMFHWLKL